MTEIKSPLGKKVIGNNFREFSIPDEDESTIQSLRQAEEEIKRERYLKLNPDKERMSDNSKKRIEILLNLTTLKKEVVIEGTKFLLRTLKSSELRQVISAAAKYQDSFEYVFELRKQILSRCIVEISGMSFDSFLGTSDLETKLEFIDEMDESLSKQLHSSYEDLFQESQDKYGIKTEQQVKEVLEDLKK